MYKCIESGSEGEGGWTPERGLSARPSSAAVGGGGGRRRGKKKQKHQLLYRDVFFTFAPDRTRSVDLPDGLTAAGVAILSTQGDETEMETVHNTPRDTVRTWGWLAGSRPNNSPVAVKTKDCMRSKFWLGVNAGWFFFTQYMEKLCMYAG